MKMKKRSEVLAELPEAVGCRTFGKPWWDAVLDYFEKNGVQFDPEEKPLPERLAWEAPFGWTADGRLLMEEQPFPGRRDQVFLEAARRYNAWPELRSIIEGEPCIAPMDKALEVQARLLAILDGKP